MNTAPSGLPVHRPSPSQSDLLTRLLEQALTLGGGVPALKFRADNYCEVGALDELESNGWLKRESDRYVVQSVVLPLLDTDPARHALTSIERVYAVLRDRYLQAQEAQVPLSSLAVQAKLSLADTTSALRAMLDNSIWCRGWSTDLNKEDAFVSPSETILKHKTYESLAEEVRGWRASSPFNRMGIDAAPSVEAADQRKTREPVQMDNLLRAWPAVRACLQEFSFYDIKEVAGLAGFDVTAAAHLVQKAQGGATKGQLMSAVDEQVAQMSLALRRHFLTVLIEEVLRRRPEAQEKLSEYLNRLGWAFANETLIPLELFDADTLSDTPDESHHDLLKAAQRLRDGDLGGAISAACGAVDAATSRVYAELGLGDPTKASFQERCRKAALAKGVLVELDQQLNALGWLPADVAPFKKNLEGALNQGAYVMQTLRSHMGDVHGTKPILRSLVFDCLRWAELLVGSLVQEPDPGLSA